MTTIIQGDQLREIALGRGVVTGQRQDIGTGGAATYGLFEVAGGEVLITALWGKVSTSVTVANTVSVQTNPTTGTTAVVVTATDIGTTDTAAGTTLGVNDVTAADPGLAVGGRALRDLVVTTGQIESIVTGSSPDGVVDWFCTWVPLTDGATVVASTQAAA